jgi:hypothetical protein
MLADKAPVNSEWSTFITAFYNDSKAFVSVNGPRLYLAKTNRWYGDVMSSVCKKARIFADLL